MREITCRNLPEPVAHFSLIKKSAILPSGVIFAAFVNCPPMSIIIRAVGKRQWQPLA